MKKIIEPENCKVSAQFVRNVLSAAIYIYSGQSKVQNVHSIIQTFPKIEKSLGTLAPILFPGESLSCLISFPKDH